MVQALSLYVLENVWLNADVVDEFRLREKRLCMLAQTGPQTCNSGVDLAGPVN